MSKIKIGQLVESFAWGFGRITDILTTGAIEVSFNRLMGEKKLYYKPEDFHFLKFFNDDETEYVEITE